MSVLIVPERVYQDMSAAVARLRKSGKAREIAAVLTDCLGKIEIDPESDKRPAPLRGILLRDRLREARENEIPGFDGE